MARMTILLISIILMLALIFYTSPKPEEQEFNFEDPSVPALKITEICLQGIIYYVGYYVDTRGRVEGGPMTPKYVQDNLFPVRCKGDISKLD